MDSDSECDRRSVSKADTTLVFKARARKGGRFQGFTQAAAASRAEALEEDVSDEVDAQSDEPSHKIILPLGLTSFRSYNLLRRLARRQISIETE